MVSNSDFISVTKLTCMISLVLLGVFLASSIIIYSILFMIFSYISVPHKFATIFFVFMLVLGIAIILITCISIIKRREVLPIINTHKIWMGYVVIICELITVGLNKDSAKLLRSFIRLHNEFIMTFLNKKNVIENVLILLPHCIQLGSCNLKITSDINNCKRCGKCVVADLLVLSEEFCVDIFISTGGTMARKVIKDRKSDFILAVACERDLLSGIRDTLAMPVIGVLNERPFGPCFNTTVSVESMREILSGLKLLSLK